MGAIADRAERLSRIRSVVAVTLGTVLIATQQQRMDGGAGPFGWVLTGLIMAAFLLWASGLFRRPAVCGILNDEGSALNRRRALTIGFWNMLTTAIVCYALSYVKEYGPRDAIQIIISVGMSSALISFGLWEGVSTRR